MNINQKIYRAIQKGLNEALTNISVDDFEDNLHDEFTDNEEIDRYKGDNDTVFFNDIINECICTNNPRPIRRFEKKHFDEMANKHAGEIPVPGNSLEILRKWVENAINYVGPDVNLNWIDVSNMTTLRNLFKNTEFNGDISKWDVRMVQDMEGLFCNSKFNGDISKWITVNVRNMCLMFAWSPFNGDISNWDVINVRSIHQMFDSSEFNGDISNWDVRNVRSVQSVFNRSKFCGDISKWNISDEIYGWDLDTMFGDMPYDKLPQELIDNLNKLNVHDNPWVLKVSKTKFIQNRKGTPQWKKINFFTEREQLFPKTPREDVSFLMPILQKDNNLSNYYDIRLAKTGSIKIENNHTLCTIGYNTEKKNYYYSIVSMYKFRARKGTMYRIDDDPIIKHDNVKDLTPWDTTKRKILYDNASEQIVQDILNDPYINNEWIHYDRA